MSDKLSGIQYAVLVGGNAAARAKSTTYESLIRKGYLVRNPKQGRTDFTEKAKDFIKSKMKVKKNLIISDYPDYSNKIIDNDKALLDIYAECILCDCELEIYVYGGKVGMITVHYPSETFKALIDPYYLWQIEVEHSAGKFLKRESVLSAKGSYLYKIDKCRLDYAQSN